jgi:hypothetical protein
VPAASSACLEHELEEAGGQGRAGEHGPDAAVGAHALGVCDCSVHLQQHGRQQQPDQSAAAAESQHPSDANKARRLQERARG